MKTHLTEEEVYEMASQKLDVSNIKVDRLYELGRLLDLEYDEEKDAYYNPDCYGCGKVLDKKDLEFGKKSPPYLCVTCYTSNA